MTLHKKYIRMYTICNKQFIGKQLRKICSNKVDYLAISFFYLTLFSEYVFFFLRGNLNSIYEELRVDVQKGKNSGLVD